MKFKTEMKSKILIHILILTAICGAVFWQTSCTTVPVSGRSSFGGMVSDAEVIKMSIEQFEVMKSQFPISRNPKYNAMLQEVGQNIAKVVGYDIINPDWEFIVFDDPGSINALAMAGGKVGVFTGIFKVAKTKDDLAIVIGHEIAHVSAKHVNERLSKAIIGNSVGAGLSILTGGGATLTGGAIMTAYGFGSQLGGLGFNRRMETEADEIGLIYAARAGYDPRAAIDLWERMAQEGTGAAPAEFFSTHPSHGTRIMNIHAQLPKAIQEYELAKSGGIRENITIIE